MDPLQIKLESILFVSSRPLSTKELASLVESDEKQVEESLFSLQSQRQSGGIVLLHASGSWQLATSPSSVNSVRKFLQSDLKEKLTEASLEVLSIVAYKQPISKTEIEAIRGVNSQYSIRTLLMRGLIEKRGDSRNSKYVITTDFLQYLGITTVSELPDYENISKQVHMPDTPETRNEARAVSAEDASKDANVTTESLSDAEVGTPLSGSGVLDGENEVI